MKTLNALIVFAILSMSLQSFAAINCRPEINDCDMSGNNDPRPIPVRNKHLAFGYGEVASANCESRDLEVAILIARNNAIEDVLASLGDTAVQVGEFRYSERCAQGFYSTSARGNSWIVQAFGDFVLP